MMGWKVCELLQGLRPTRVWRCVEARVIERGWAQNSHFPNAVCAPGCWVPLATVAPGRMYHFVCTVRVMTPSSQVVLSFNGIMYLKWWCTACPRHSVHGRRSCPCFYPPSWAGCKMTSEKNPCRELRECFSGVLRCPPISGDSVDGNVLTVLCNN